MLELFGNELIASKAAASDAVRGLSFTSASNQFFPSVLKSISLIG